MLKVNTYLRLGIKLSERIRIEDISSLLLGLAYFESGEGEKDKAFEEGDFSLGCRFRLWIDDFAKTVDFEDVNEYDRLICDMPVIISYIENIKERKLSGKELRTFQKVIALEHQPMPLYLVSVEKSARYSRILDNIVDNFVGELK